MARSPPPVTRLCWFPSRPTPAGWAPAAAVAPASAPVAKTTLPLEVHSGLLPVETLQLSRSRYYFDFGRERTGGFVLKVPAATATLWGGAGSTVEVRLGEQVSAEDPHAVLWPTGGAAANWNKIPTWVSRFTLDDGPSVFEQHEYVTATATATVIQRAASQWLGGWVDGQSSLLQRFR